MVRAATAVLTAIAGALWLAWAARDFQDNQRNWLYVLAITASVAAVSSLLVTVVGRVRDQR